MRWIVLIAAVWLGCAVLIYGMELAYFQQKYPTVRERGDAGTALVLTLVIGILGPVGLVISYFMNGFARYGLQFIAKDAQP